MTRQSNISIPARFVFRPFRARWELAWASIVGWGEKPMLMSLLPIGDPKMTLDSESVIISVALRRVEGESDDALGLHAGLDGLTGQYDSFELKVKRGDIPPDSLQPHENPYTAPDIAGRDFAVLVCRLPNVNTLDGSPQPGEALMDAWAMREQFFTMGDNGYDALQFLNRWGLWNLERHYEPGSSFLMGNIGRPAFALVSPHRLWTLRDSYIKAAAGSSRAWLTTATPLSLKETDKRPYFVVERSYCEEAIKATLTIDHLGRVRFGICKRHDCRRLFKRTSAQKRLYCTPECAHLANVRKLRAEKRKAQPTPKARKTDAKG
jgi:hypothetical protein